MPAGGSGATIEAVRSRAKDSPAGCIIDLMLVAVKGGYVREPPRGGEAATRFSEGWPGLSVPAFRSSKIAW